MFIFILGALIIIGWAFPQVGLGMISLLVIGLAIMIGGTLLNLILRILL